MIEGLTNLFTVLMLRLRIIGEALAAIVQIAMAIQAAPGTGWGEKAKAAAADPKLLRLGGRVLRAFAPVLVLSRTFVTAYPNTGTALVTRDDDVREVLDRNLDFEVVYEPRMRLITAGDNFFLGMQSGAAYTRDTSAMHLAMRQEDVPTIVAPMAIKEAEAIVAASSGRLDVPDLSLAVPTAIVTDYLGIDGGDDGELIEWASLMFWYLFIDLGADVELDERALAAARMSRALIDAAVQRRKAADRTTPPQDTVIDRCLALQKAGVPGMDDVGIRNNLIGLMIGAIPTISKASIQALDQLLDQPEALRTARRAALSGDEALFASHVFEAMRFNPVNPLIYRRASRTTSIAAGTLRGRTIPKDTMVMAANLSAMFDPMKVMEPESFRVDRPWGTYMLWGYGMHECFGAQVNRAVVPAILKPLVAKPGLRRAGGAAGRIDSGATPFPRHFVVEWE